MIEGLPLSASAGPFVSSEIEMPSASAGPSGRGPESPTPTLAGREGETIGEFRLLACLGRGSRCAVYLATQPSLADRPVVLKLIPRRGQEHLSLARLQHPHIVPLHGVQELQEHALRAMCMPYLGRATLGRLLELLGPTPVRCRAGRDLIEGLDRLGAEAPAASSAGGPARQFLLHASYVRAVCWIGACLAEALQHAHGQGILHLDVKPSNVLIAADGRPMLLDFHLARRAVRPGERPPFLGGTPDYMSPEQRAVFEEMRGGRVASRAVDHRSDLYSLGCLLLAMLGGAVPARASAVRDLREAGIPRPVADVIGRCLAEDPGRRHPDAAALAADLRGCLTDPPASRAGGRGPLGRWPGRAVVVASAVILTAGLVIAEDLQRRIRGAEAALAAGSRLSAAREYDRAIRTLSRGLALTESMGTLGLGRALPRARELSRSLGEQLRRARSARSARDAEALHRLVDGLRVFYGMDPARGGSSRSLEPRLRAAWEHRGRAAAGLGAGPGAPQASRLRADLLDLAILWADLRVRLFAGEDVRAAREEALQILAQAEELLGPCRALASERRRYAAAPGRPDSPRDPRPETPAASAEDSFLLGRRLLADGDLEAAALALDRAIDARPDHLWARFYRGVCADRSRRPEDAVDAFTVCIALAPRSAECYYMRGRVLDGLDRSGPALHDYDRALQLDPSLATASLARGLLHGRAGRASEAIADLQRALADGADPATIHLNLAVAYLRRGDRASALANVHRALEHDPGLGEARALEERIRRSGS